MNRNGPEMLAGRVFDRLTVTNIWESRARHRTYWLCKCRCGAERWVISTSLKSGATRSCGCLNDEARRLVRHGGGRNGMQSREYKSWHSMKQRCLNDSDRRYAQYGGRGITVCQRWIDSFEAFLSDMGPRPAGTSLDRIDNARGYSPDNCRWATVHQQNRNTTRNRFYTFNGETLCIADWCARLGIKHATLHARLARWPLERAFTEAVKSPRREPSGCSPRPRP